MIEPVINYKPEIDALSKEIVDKYWKNENGNFGISRKDLLATYSLTPTKLESIIKENSSYETIFPICVNCKLQNSKIARLRKEVTFISFTGDYKCNPCLEYLHRESEILKKQEFNNELNIRLERGIKDKKWLSLNSIEFEILKQFIIHKTKKQIFNFIFNNNIYVKDIWKVVNTLSNLDLVIAEREGRSIVEFHFDKRLESLINDHNPVIPVTPTSPTNDVFSFSLCKKRIITKAEDPEFSGTFILPEDIILTKGIKYIYAGWRNSDGSINFKFTPLNKINKKPFQGNIDNDPQAIGDILKMNNNFEKDDDVNDSDKDDESGIDESDAPC